MDFSKRAFMISYSNRSDIVLYYHVSVHSIN